MVWDKRLTDYFNDRFFDFKKWSVYGLYVNTSAVFLVLIVPSLSSFMSTTFGLSIFDLYIYGFIATLASAFATKRTISTLKLAIEPMLCNACKKQMIPIAYRCPECGAKTELQ